VAEGATYYVATTGNNANAGAETTPFQTLNKGVSVLKPGDTLYVRQGTYVEKLFDSIPAGTSWTQPVTVAAYPGEKVTIQPNAAEHVLVFQGSDTHYIIIDGFIIDGANSLYNGVKITSTSQGGAHHIRIKNTEIKNTQTSGILVTAGADYNEFINLDVHHTGLSATSGSDGGGHGVYIGSANNLLERSSIHDNRKVGIQVYNGKGGVNNNIIRYNKSYKNGTAGLSDGKSGLIIGSGSGTIAYNNIVWGNPGSGITVGYGASGVKVYNNTTYDNQEYGIDVRSSSNTEVKNNIIYGNKSGSITNAGTGTIQQNNLTDNPNFVDPAKGNFKLNSGSPAIDKGSALTQIKDDFEGTPRPQGSGHDIGAYEYKVGLPSPKNLRVINVE
jgi:parallel beta-helix repeat protein